MIKSALTGMGWHFGDWGVYALSEASGQLVANMFWAFGTQLSQIIVPVYNPQGGGIQQGYLRCRIVSDYNDLSNPIATGYNSSDASSQQFVVISGFGDHTLTAGQRYWAVFDNIHDSGSGRSVALRGYQYLFPVDSYSYQLFRTVIYTTSWSEQQYGRIGIGAHYEFANGSIYGHAIMRNQPDMLWVYGNRMAGIKVTTRSDLGINLVGFGFRSAVGNLNAAYSVYQDDTLLSTTAYLTRNGVITLRPAVFPDIVQLQPNTTYRLVARSPDGSGSSTQAYVVPRVKAYDMATGKRMYPFFESIVYTENTGSGWVDYPNDYYLPFSLAIITDGEQPFIIPTSGGGGVFLPTTRVIM